jgi:transposase
MSRDQAWLLPPTLDELVPEDHPARFVAEFVDALERTEWEEMGVPLDGEPMGAPAYHPGALLSVWLYGFMTGVRSTRKLEAACREQIPYLWLTGWQHPDHNTLWRFYKAHRSTMHGLLKHTVRTAIAVGLVDLVLQAVDGTKVAASAAGDRTHDAKGLERLLAKTEAAIKDLEAQNEGSEGLPPPRLPSALQQTHALRERVQAAMKHLEDDRHHKRTNLTDEDAQLMKGRQGILPAYNAQTMASPLNPDEAGGNGMMITAADVTACAADSGQLVPILEQAEDTSGERAEVTLADGGYHTGANLEACENRGQLVVMPEGKRKIVKRLYFKDRFVYDPITDSYHCPRGEPIPFQGLRKNNGRISGPYRVYRASRTVCHPCPAYGVCTKDKHSGRALWIGPTDALLRRHRQWMETESAKRWYARRKELIEPVFGIIKEQQGGRRFLLRGLDNVRSEFRLLATAFNLRTLWRWWSSGRRPSATSQVSYLCAGHTLCSETNSLPSIALSSLQSAT